MSDARVRPLVDRALDGVAEWEAGFAPFETDPSLAVPPERAAAVLDELVRRLRDNYPFFHPSYAGQMLKPPHPVALAAYAAAMRINPNNHALDGGPATAAMEREAVAAIAAMFGYREPFLGHLTSSGTIANLEAIWVATRRAPGKAIAHSSEAHYTHARMAEVVGARSVAVAVDACGRLDVDALAALPADDIGLVVATAGTTSCGAVDPIDDIIGLARERGWRVHVDAAYGGFYAAIAGVADAHLDAARWRAIASSDSLAIDPHKHGLQPYGCGCVLFADPGVGALYQHDSPYTYFTSKALHLGEISLECSRAGASAAALWATLACFPLTPDGLGKALFRSRSAALAGHGRALASGRLVPVVVPELDILAVAPALPGARTRASTVSERAERLFRRCADDRDAPLHLAKWRVPEAFGKRALPDIDWDGECTVIRSVLMKPEHASAVHGIVDRIAAWD